MANGHREGEQSWYSLLLDCKQRDLTIDPKLATADGASGFWKVLGNRRTCSSSGIASAIAEPARTFRSSDSTRSRIKAAEMRNLSIISLGYSDKCPYRLVGFDGKRGFLGISEGISGWL